MSTATPNQHNVGITEFAGRLLGAVVLAIIAVMLWQEMSTESNGYTLQATWDSMSPAQQTAMCAPVRQNAWLRDPAGELAAVVNDPDVSVYTARSFLLKVCASGQR